MERIQRSAKLRYTERIAELCGFDNAKGKYGGWFTVYQLEQIVRKVEGLQVQVDELKLQIPKKAGDANADTKIQSG